ncbi:MAG: FG-GAP repeat protein [Candidatus Promineifilaceae bacterium]
MPHASLNRMISSIRPKWLVLTAVLLLTLSYYSKPALAARTASALPDSHFQSIKPSQIPQGMSAADWDGVQQAYMKASNTEVEDLFGLAVAVSGKTVVVGAYSEDSNATGVDGDQANNMAADSGAAYVFVRSGGVWSQQAYLKASNTGANDQFGRAVAISGDTIVVGAHFEDSNATTINGDGTNDSFGNSGAAYVFVRNGTAWSQQAYLKAANAGASDEFGYSVAVSGDTVVVGAYLEDSSSNVVNGADNNSAADSGAAYVFVRSGGVWSQQAYLKASNTDPADRFGYSVAISGNTVVVGATEEDSDANGVNGDQTDNSLFSVGAAYVFVRSGTTWIQEAYMKASNSGNGDVFGSSVAVSGNTVVVGARGEDSNATGINGDETNDSYPNSGAAYIFARSGGTWSQQAYLKASNSEPDDRFGDSVALSGDKLVVGARQEDSGETGVNGNQTDNSAGSAGAAYIFTRSGETWNQQAYLKASNTDGSDLFGFSVNISGDTVIIGAPFEDGSTTGVNGADNDSTADSGAAFLFRDSFCSNQSGNWSDAATWVGSSVPGATHHACIAAGETVILDGAAAVDSLVVYPDATLDLSTFSLTAENGVTNHGTLSQTLTVDSALVEFLHIQNAASTTTSYRGLNIDSSGSGQNLGAVEVSVRETVDWYPVMNGDGLDTSQYCTTNDGNSPTYAQRCFTIKSTNEPVTDVTLRLWGLTNELNGIAESNLAVYRNSPGGSSTWVELTVSAGTGSDGGNYSFAQADSPGFSDFLLGQSGIAPTAVTLTGGEVNDAVNLPVLMLLSAVLLLGLVSFYLLRRWGFAARRRPTPL